MKLLVYNFSKKQIMYNANVRKMKDLQQIRGIYEKMYRQKAEKAIKSSSLITAQCLNSFLQSTATL